MSRGFYSRCNLYNYKENTKREKIYQAHRSHAYQYAARYFDSHTPVTLAVLIINLIWLLPCAFFVLNKAISPLVGLIIAYFPLIILAIYFNAGQLEHKT